MNNPLVSIIIPHFNQKQYLRDAIGSAINQTYPHIEIIVVDDGSTQDGVSDELDSLSHPKLNIIRTENQGLSAARNTGIYLSKGKYILPLDSDDMISSSYVLEAVKLLESDQNLGIVYSHAVFFGEVNNYWPLPKFNEIDFLTANCIFAAAMYRKSDWRQVGGYKSDMIYGLEDYDFWLSLIEIGRKVAQLPDVHFFYRKHGISMINGMTQEKLHYSYEKIISRHQGLYQRNILNLIVKIGEQKRNIDSLKEGLLAQAA
ncbi:MAG: hypothetical protein RI949_507 [Pseudomonadota bacterium]|jgi:glycosyltransferase involved in cell wall biosynthesis